MKIVRWFVAAAFVLATLAGCNLFQGTISVQNSSGYTVIAVFISPSTDSNWGDNWLDTSILPGASVQIDSFCADTYDLMAMEPGGGGWLAFGLEVKAGSSYYWTLTDANYIGP
jgi:hypothetical protein